MGWVSSPPNFSACTETIADLVNADLLDPAAMQHARVTPHRLDVISETDPASTTTSESNPPSMPSSATHSESSIASVAIFPNSTCPFWKPISYWDIYVDNFCALSQGKKWQRRTVKHILFQALDKIFRPLDAGDTPFQQEPVSLTKWKNGDTQWSATKVILGGFLDTITKTISLPEHRAQRLHEILSSVTPYQRWIATKAWHKIVGELRSMSIALPGCAGLFSVLQEAF